MSQEKDDCWIRAAELVGIGGLPNTVAGLHKKAAKFNWAKKSVPVPGVRGRSFAYKFSDLPKQVQSMLEKGTVTRKTIEKKGVVTHASPDKKQVVMLMLEQLQDSDQEQLVNTLLLHGINKLMKLVDDDYMALLELDGMKLQTALLLRFLPESKVREILSHLENGTSQSTIAERRASA